MLIIVTFSFFPPVAEPADNCSQDTVLLDREDGEEEGEEERDEGEEPIISEESIFQVVSSSQSFRQEMIDEPLGLYNSVQTSVGSLIQCNGMQYNTMQKFLWYQNP